MFNKLINMSDSKDILNEKKVTEDHVEFPIEKEETMAPVSSEVSAQKLDADEKRKNKRADIDTAVLLYDASGQLFSKAKATSVSEMGAGLKIETKIDMQIGLELTVEFNGNKSIPSFTLKAEVTDFTQDEHSTVVSIKFTQVSKMCQNHLRTYIEHH